MAIGDSVVLLMYFAFPQPLHTISLHQKVQTVTKSTNHQVQHHRYTNTTPHTQTPKTFKQFAEHGVRISMWKSQHVMYDPEPFSNPHKSPNSQHRVCRANSVIAKTFNFSLIAGKKTLRLPTKHALTPHSISTIHLARALANSKFIVRSSVTGYASRKVSIRTFNR